MDRPLGEKWCGDCERLLRLDQFHYKDANRGVFQSYCKTCQRLRSRAHYVRNSAAYKERVARNTRRTRAANRERLREYLALRRCDDCGLRDLAVLEFDHRDPAKKVGDVSTMVQKGFAWTTILLEIAKCDVVCATCHRRRTARQFGWHKLAPRPLALPALPRRGTSDYEHIKSRRSGLARRDRNRLLVWMYLKRHPCELCGEADPVVLEFDHLGDKYRDIGWLVPASCRAKILVEIEKCRVLCANCHRRHTALQRGRAR